MASKFLEIPVEIRLIAYGHIFASSTGWITPTVACADHPKDKRVELSEFKHSRAGRTQIVKTISLSILSTCKKVKSEAEEVVWRVNVVWIYDSVHVFIQRWGLTPPKSFNCVERIQLGFYLFERGWGGTSFESCCRLFGMMPNLKEVNFIHMDLTEAIGRGYEVKWHAPQAKVVEEATEVLKKLSDDRGILKGTKRNSWSAANNAD